MTRNERELKAVKKAMFERSEQIQQVWKKADDEDRAASEDERLSVEELVKEIKTVLEPRQAELEHAVELEQDVKRMSRDLGPVNESAVEFRQEATIVPGGEPVDRMVKSLGEQLTESSGFKSASEAWEMGRTQFSTGGIEIKSGTVSETTGGYALAYASPQVVPGVVDTLFAPPNFGDLLLQGQTDKPSIRYILEGTAVSGAAGVAEAGFKEESSLGLSLTDEPVKKLATRIVVSDELMEDVGALQSYVNGRLSLFIRQQEEVSLLSGAGTNDLVGVNSAANTRAINTIAKGSDNILDTLFKAMNGQRGSAKLEPDFIVMHPDNWVSARLFKDSTDGTIGQYFGGGPFMGPYGVGSQVPANSQFTGANDYLWGKQVYISSNLVKGTALIGTRSAAQIFRRGGITVEASNNGYVGGKDLFSNNLLQIRAEERLALCVYRPAAFTRVSGL